MRVVNISSGDGWRLGVVAEGGVLDVLSLAQASRRAHHVPLSVMELIQPGETGLASLQDLVESAAGGQGDWWMDQTAVDFGPVIPNPGKVIGIGLNYRQHALESGASVPEIPILFSKFNNSLAAHGAEIRLPKLSEQYDYEAELAVVIGKKAREVDVSDALTHVFGYTCANDISARDLQMQTGQWLIGKTLDGFLPLGPYLVTADEVPDPQVLAISCWVNGELRQSSNTSDMVFSVAELISYISRHFTLNPGDVILTGTPEGVVLGFPEEQRRWLRPGDVVEVELSGLGRLTNIFTA